MELNAKALQPKAATTYPHDQVRFLFRLGIDTSHGRFLRRAHGGAG